MTHGPSDPSTLEPTEQTPRHGDRGSPAIGRTRVPGSLTIAISREAGARGASIARRVGERLGWQVYTQELLEYSLQNEFMRQEILDNLSPEAAEWVDAQLRRFSECNVHTYDRSFQDLVHMILALGAGGEVILIGRGASHILPRETTLSCRLVAPLADRVAYFGQWLRLSRHEAQLQVCERDRRRNDFIERHFRQCPDDVHLYDLVLNTGYMGEDLSVELITQAARARLNALYGEPEENTAVE